MGILKGLLVEYVNKLPNIHNRDMHGVKMIIEFDQRLQALNLKITSPLDTTVFKNIRLPAWIRQILPLHHSTNLVEQVYRAVLGERLYGKCILELDTCTPSTRRPTTTNWTTATTWSLLTAPRGTLTPSWPRRRTTPSTS